MSKWKQTEDDEWPEGEDDDSGNSEEWGDPDKSDQDDEDEGLVGTETCPHCGRQIFEEAELCPHCRSYISLEDAPQRKPKWIIIGVVLALAVLGMWLFGRWVGLSF